MDVMEDLFSPLSKKYCVWFYYLAVISYILFIFGLVAAIIYGVKHNKGLGYYGTALLASLSYFVMYFQNRLLFSMCVHP
jgi:hypothetical protein